MLPSKGIDWILIVCLFIAIVSLVFIPVTSGTVFNRNIVFGHGIVLLPFFFPSTKRKDDRYSSSSTFYWSAHPSIHRTQSSTILASVYSLLAGTSLLHHLISSVSLFMKGTDFLSVLFGILVAADGNHAQSSITWDLLFTTLECCAFFFFGMNQNLFYWSVIDDNSLEGGFKVGLLFAAVTPFLSLATTFPLFLVYRELSLPQPAPSKTHVK